MSETLTREQVLQLPETALLKPDEAARFLGVSRSTFDHLGLTATEVSPRIYRYRISDLIRREVTTRNTGKFHTLSHDIRREVTTGLCACKQCGEEKLLLDFPRDKKSRNGRMLYCKPCWNARNRKWRADNRAKARAGSREWHVRHREESRARSREYHKRTGYVHAVEQDRLKRWARDTLRRALRSGDIAKPDTCQRCGLFARLHGHHDDYERPLDVQWLCPACHGFLHRQERAA